MDRRGSDVILRVLTPPVVAVLVIGSTTERGRNFTWLSSVWETRGHRRARRRRLTLTGRDMSTQPLSQPATFPTELWERVFLYLTPGQILNLRVVPFFIHLIHERVGLPPASPGEPQVPRYHRWVARNAILHRSIRSRA